MSEHIGQFFENFKHLLSLGQANKELIVSILSDQSQIPISSDQVKIKGDILILLTSSIVKSELFLKRDKILAEFKSKGIRITDIR